MSLFSAAAARALGLPPATNHVLRELAVRLPAADGVELVTDLYLAAPLEPRPTVLIRSPCGRSRLVWGGLAGLFAERGYHAVIQSCRGTFGSGGRLDFHAEASDGREAADWIVSQRWSNGEIGTFGPSYLSFVQWALASTRPPQLKAMAIQIMSADRSRTYYPGGAFALDNALTWSYQMAHQEDGALGGLLTMLRQRRALEPAFRHLPLLTADEVATGRAVPFYRDWVTHQPGDEFWRELDFAPLLDEHQVPTSFVGGWYDYCLPYMLEEHGRLAAGGRDVQLVVGPWRHSSAAGGIAGFREALAWFDVHLKRDAGRRSSARVRVAMMGAWRLDWRELESWPPRAAQVAWHLQPGVGLAPGVPPPSEPDRFRYDPADPTPAVGGTSLSSNSGPRDNRALESRADVLTYTSDPLLADLEVTGPVRAELHLESSTEHFDVFARLCDVDLRGRSTNLCDGILSCGPSTARPVCVDLWPTAYRFAAGHRVRLQVSGGSHPRFARNLGTGEPLATATALAVSDRIVFHDPERPSRLLLSVVAAN
jgi:uncharacterized protein